MIEPLVDRGGSNLITYRKALQDLNIKATVISLILAFTSGKRAFGQALLVPAVIWARTKGLATSPQIRPPARQPLVPVRYNPIVPI
jgi:hypothetical protein